MADEGWREGCEDVQAGGKGEEEAWVQVLVVCGGGEVVREFGVELFVY